MRKPPSPKRPAALIALLAALGARSTGCYPTPWGFIETYKTDRATPPASGVFCVFLYTARASSGETGWEVLVPPHHGNDVKGTLAAAREALGVRDGQ